MFMLQDVLVYSFLPPPDVSNTFYLGPASGLISLKKSLLDGATDRYQFSVIASDNSLPARTATATVMVEVQRDRFLPQFVSEPYRKAVALHTQPGTVVFRVRATDQDAVGQMVYKMIGYYSAPGYFMVDSNTGDISVHSSLLTDVTAVYMVRLSFFFSPTTGLSKSVLSTICRLLQLWNIFLMLFSKKKISYCMIWMSFLMWDNCNSNKLIALFFHFAFMSVF